MDFTVQAKKALFFSYRELNCVVRKYFVPLHLSFAFQLIARNLNIALCNRNKPFIHSPTSSDAFYRSVYVQPIISKARADLLRSHFLPTLEKLKKKTVKVVSEEELLKADSKGDTQEAELLILDEFAVLCRDLYAFYPMLIRYVDNNR